MTRGNDMPNNGTFDPETKYVQLGERVDNQARQLADLDMRMRQSFTDIASQLRGLADDVRGGSKTQWPLIIGFTSVTITVLGGLGFLALQPIKDNIAQIREDARTESANTMTSISTEAANTKTSIATVVQAMVTQKEMEWRTGRGIEDRSRMETAIKDIRDGLVPRAEHERVWRNTDQQLAQIQKQIDELKAGQASTYSARDVIRLTNGGAGYTNATVAASGGGTGYDFRPVIVAGVITAILDYTVGSWGAGPTPTLTITGDGAGATAVVDRFDGIGEASYNYDQSVSVDIEYPLNTFQNVVPTKTITRGTRLDLTDAELAIEVPAGAEFGIRTTATLGTAPTFVVNRPGTAITSIDVANGGSGLWAPWYDLTITGGTGSGATARVYTYQGSAVRVDVTAGGNYTAGTQQAVLQFVIERPVVLMPLLGDKRQDGNPLTSGHPSAAPALLASAVDGRSGVVDGDSIGNGGAGGGEISGDAWGNFGWPARILGRANIGVLKHTLPGHYVSGYNANHAAQTAMIQALPGLDFALCQMGINDITRGDSLATVQASMIAEWTSFKALVAAVYQSTITTYTTSTDGWVTIVNQAAFSAAYAAGGVRALMNAWLRDGAPINAGVAVATGSNAAGTVRAGQAGHLLTGVFDVAAQLESKSDPTKHAPMAWGTTNVRQGLSADGIHPTDVYHAKVRGTVSALAIVGGSGWTVAPQVVFSGHGVPVATPVFSGGVLTGITPVSDGGIDYDYPPTIAILPLNNAGSGATATAILTNKRITGYTVTAGGTGYTNGALVSHAGAVPPQATARIVGGQVVLAEADWWGGSDISAVPTVALVGGDGTGASVVASISKGIDPALLAA